MVLASDFANDNDALSMRTDARVVGAALKADETTEYHFALDRFAYLVPPSGAVDIDGLRVNACDGRAIR